MITHRNLPIPVRQSADSLLPLWDERERASHRRGYPIARLALPQAGEEEMPTAYLANAISNVGRWSPDRVRGTRSNGRH
jgi:hypothetical protein